MRIRPATPEDEQALTGLIARFRAELDRLHGDRHHPRLRPARAEAAEYRQEGFPMFVAEEDGCELVGYLVCRVAGDVVWAESLYVLPACRRSGIASRLYAEAEHLAQERGGDAPYNWVHPNNEAVIRFLQRRGYDVLNLVEVRRPRPGETLSRQVRVGEHAFRYP